MTLVSELIAVPEQVHKSDFVISLESAIAEPEQTLYDYVVTPQLADCFHRALSLVATSVADRKSKAAYLHASFGAGKTAMMAVLHLLLQGNASARAIPELAPLVARYASQLDGRRFLLVPFHFVGKSSMEQGVLGGYVDHVRRLHPAAPMPAVYVADGILGDAVEKRRELGDESFFRILSEGEGAEEWGDLGAAWDASRFETALAAGPGSSERDQLVGALLRTHHRAVPGQAQATGEGFVPLDAGLDIISRHAQSLGYDALVLFLDELVLWLAARMSDVAFVSREGAKIVKLVEAGKRPVPIVSFIARQRDLRELVGEHVPGAQSLTAIDVLRHSEGRFDTITLEDRNLPVIAERRLLRPRSEAARQELDDEFERLRVELDERNEADVLLTDLGDLTDFRRLYPFSPALVQALVALSGAMQRERTALKVMAQLLVESRDELQVGELIPLGDLWDAVDAGDEPLTEIMRSQFAQGRRLWKQRFEPVLLRDHDLTEERTRLLPRSHAFVTEARLAKSLLVAALVPEAAPLRSLTVSRLTALNAGTVKVFVPGTERQRVLTMLRRWNADIGELRLGEDEQDPTVAVALTGIDTRPLLDAAGAVDYDGARRRRVHDMLVSALEVRDAGSFDPHLEVLWRGTRRHVAVRFGNVRDPSDLPDDVLRAGDDPKLVIDFPWDPGDYTPIDDRGRVSDFVASRPPEWTAVWLPNHFTETTRQLLSRLVRLDHILTGDTFEDLASYLPPADRLVAKTQLENERMAVEQQVGAALRQAYGVDPSDSRIVSEGLPRADQFLSLDKALAIQPPVGPSLRAHAEELANRLFGHRYPGHPEYAELVTRSDRTQTLRNVVRALGQPNWRLEDVESPSRKVLTKVAGPLRLGTMYASHFIADPRVWIDLIDRRRTASGANTPTVAQLRQWLDGADTPTERRGLQAEDADLVILAVAAATDRALVSAGQRMTEPEIGRLQADWQLVPHELPSPGAWDEARQRAEDMGIVALSTLRSASTVADLDDKIRELVESNAQGARDLVPRLDAAFARLEIEPDGDRRRTAAAAVMLLDTIHAHPGRAVDALAGAIVPTTAASLGSSLAKAGSVAAALDVTNWRLLTEALALGGDWVPDAGRIRDRLVEALRADQLAVDLVARLRQAEETATDLVGRAARAATTPAIATLPAPPEPTGARPSYSAEQASLVKTAQVELGELRDRLAAAGLRLRWDIEALPDAGG